MILISQHEFTLHSKYRRRIDLPPGSGVLSYKRQNAYMAVFYRLLVANLCDRNDRVLSPEDDGYIECPTL
jgi:hypothetical protein